jgi:hypothetical protein
MNRYYSIERLSKMFVYTEGEKRGTVEERKSREEEE